MKYIDPTNSILSFINQVTSDSSWMRSSAEKQKTQFPRVLFLYQFMYFNIFMWLYKQLDVQKMWFLNNDVLFCCCCEFKKKKKLCKDWT